MDNSVVDLETLQALYENVSTVAFQPALKNQNQSQVCSRRAETLLKGAFFNGEIIKARVCNGLGKVNSAIKGKYTNINCISVLSCQSDSHKYTMLCNKPSVIIQSAAADSAERSPPHRSVWEKDSAVNYGNKEHFLEALPGLYGCFWL